MSITDNILPYATATRLPISWHAKVSFKIGILFFPIMITLGLLRWLDPVTIALLPMNKTSELFVCFRVFTWYLGPLCALCCGISALIRIRFNRPNLQGIGFACAGITLAFTDHIAGAILLPIPML